MRCALAPKHSFQASPSPLPPFSVVQTYLKWSVRKGNCGKCPKLDLWKGLWIYLQFTCDGEWEKVFKRKIKSEKAHAATDSVRTEKWWRSLFPISKLLCWRSGKPGQNNNNHGRIMEMEKFIKALTKYEIPEWLLRQECVRKAKGKATHILCLPQKRTNMHSGPVGSNLQEHGQWGSFIVAHLTGHSP